MGGPSSAGNANPPKPTSAADAKDLTDLASHMSGIGISLDTSTLASFNFDNVKEAAFGVERIAQEFPQAVFAFQQIVGMDRGQGTYASASLGGTIRLNEFYYGQDPSSFAVSVTGDENSDFHPKGGGTLGVAVHEAGHVLEAALIKRAISVNSYLDQLAQSDAWHKSTYASRVISEAAKAAKKTPNGKGKTVASLIREVSRYATKNRSEALAECVADYFANGSNAKPLSIATWDILKRELG